MESIIFCHGGTWR